MLSLAFSVKLYLMSYSQWASWVGFLDTSFALLPCPTLRGIVAMRFEHIQIVGRGIPSS